MKKWLAIGMGMVSLVACDGGSSGSPTAPTPSVPPANIAGSYGVNLIASATCSANLPLETRTLGFLATVTQTGGAIQVQFTAHAPGTPSFTTSGTVSGQAVSVPSFSFDEAVGRGAKLAGGSANASVGANGTITGTVSGAFQTSSGASCSATNHQIEMIKLCPQTVDQGTVLAPCVGI